jgi:hypothetical protein
MPRPVQVIDLGFREPLDRELRQQLVEALAVQIVELRPLAAVIAHLVHRRLIQTAPGIGELGPVYVEPLLLAERLAFADQARSPVHDGAEHIERERLDVLDGHDSLRSRVWAASFARGSPGASCELVM